MINRFPEQSASRKSYAMLGGFFFLFGLVMAMVESELGMAVGLLLGLTLLVPSLMYGRERFVRFERWISWLSTFGNIS